MAEIMAPAGSMEQLIASVRSGAHRVYFGCGDLNARRNAKGFDDPVTVIEYCHARGVKATAALNILLTNSQLDRAAHLIERVAEAGGDGLIVQDLAAYRLAKEICPDLPLHASTQMTVHNIDGVKALEQLGFRRAVLARELSLKEIEAIRKATDMELELFVHGALCMSVSGQCYLSSLLGGRSGNRGLCAQPCRLNFQTDAKEYALSLKDMSCLGLLPKLAELGIDAFKIEGRMKRPEYAAAVIHEAVRALEGREPDIPLLRSVFSRSGFTDGYLTGHRGADMFGYRTREDTADTANVLPKLAALYRGERQHIPVDMELVVHKDQPISLTVSDGTESVTVQGDVPVLAINRPLIPEFARECLFRCGGTPYLPGKLTCTMDDNCMVSMASLKGLRKSALEQLTVRRMTACQRKCGSHAVNVSPYQPAKKPEVYVQAQTFEQIEGLTQADRVILPAHIILQQPKKASQWGNRLFAALPTVQFSPGEVATTLTGLKKLGITGVQVENIDAILPAKAMGFQVTGGAHLNITNALALEEYARLGVEESLLSFELSQGEYKNLGGAPKRGMLVYGHLPLMRLRACPLKKATGCDGCEGTGVLTDRKGMRFSAVCHQRQFTTLYNPIPLYLGDKKTLPVDYVQLLFTQESPAACQSIYHAVLNGKKPDFQRTCGLYERTLL